MEKVRAEIDPKMQSQFTYAGYDENLDAMRENKNSELAKLLQPLKSKCSGMLVKQELKDSYDEF